MNTLKEILEFEGHEISLAEDGASGLEAAAAGNFDVIFCDIKMPGMDGVEVLDKLSESGNEAPVVMISGHGSIDTAVECIKKGAYDFIQKPLDLNRILITLKNATDKSTLVRETKALKKKVGGPDRCEGAHNGSQRYRQGTRGPLAAREERPLVDAFYRGQLCGYSERAYRERALRSREGRVHRSSEAA